MGLLRDARWVCRVCRVCRRCAADFIALLAMLAGHGVRRGKAMITTLRWRLIAVAGRLIRHTRHLTSRLPPGQYLLPGTLTRRCHLRRRW